MVDRYSGVKRDLEKAGATSREWGKMTDRERQRNVVETLERVEKIV